VIYDPVGGDYAEPALRSIAWEGRYLVVGFPAGIPRLRSTSPCSRAATSAESSGAPSPRATPKANAAHIQTLFRLWSEGKIAPKVSRTWPLEQGGEAIAYMAARKAIGKLVVTMD
jgi:NADPH:quinone reductase-like Zn-dependent oxidoreductase